MTASILTDSVVATTDKSGSVRKHMAAKAPRKELSSNRKCNVRVVSRIRPLLLPQEAGSEAVVNVIDNCVLQVDNSVGAARYFEMDTVLPINCSQQEVYVKSGAKQAVCESIFQGLNCTILAYGQTGAGKTFTMGTASGRDDDEAGVIPRACKDLFRSIQVHCDGNAHVKLSYMEIYNEEIRDLLVDSATKTPRTMEPDSRNETPNSFFSPASINSDARITPKQSSLPKLSVRETLNGEVYVSGLTSRTVTSPDEIGDCMEEASSRRVVGSTKMNSESSRSHALCVLTLEGVLEDGVKFQSKLTFVDLAGSEKLGKTQAEGTRRQEGININRGLFVLGQVISALSEQRSKHKRKPPYRDSKLTRLLQDSLGGNSQTIMIACVSPATTNTEETINTLRYATSARNIKNTATRNVIRSISAEEAAKLERDNQLLQKQVKEMRETIESMIMEATEASSIPSMVESREPFSPTVSFSASGDSSNSHMKRIAELEYQVETLEMKLSKAKKTARKTAHVSAVEYPELKMQVEVMEDELKEANQIKQENEAMYEQLLDLKAEAASSRLAAAKMSQLLEEIKEDKREHAKISQTETRKVKLLAQESNSWSIMIVLILSFQLILTGVGFSKMAYHNMGRNSFESKVGNLLESIESKSCSKTRKNWLYQD